MRSLVIGDEVWGFMIRGSGVQIQHPEGRKTWYPMHTFGLALGVWIDEYQSRPGIGPGDVRRFIDRVFRSVEPLPEFLASLTHPHIGYAFSSLPRDEVLRRVREVDPRFRFRAHTDPGSLVGGEDSYSKGSVLSPSHRHYILIRDMDDAAQQSTTPG